MAIEQYTKIGIISAAAVLCGEKPVISLNEDRYAATVGSTLFEILYENEVQTGSWRFATKKWSLSRLVLTPLNQFRYAYQLPVDCLIPSHVYPRTQYEIFGDRIYTDAESVELDGRFKPPITALPAYFALLMVYSLAKDMIKPITESDDAQTKMERKFSLQLSRALFADAQGRPATPVQDNPFVQVRGAN